MDLVAQFKRYQWLKTVWCFPSMSGATNELLMQCANEEIPETPDPDCVFEDVLSRSDQFPIAFPIESVRLKYLKEKRNSERLKKNILSTYPLIHERLLLLITHFLVYKRQHGSLTEKSLYADLGILEFIERLLKIRAISFFGPCDKYKLISGEVGPGGWESVGGPAQKPPLTLDKALSYDEMKLSAMLFVSGHTEFINNGARQNHGIYEDENIEDEGVIIGLIGPRLKRTLRMEYEDMVISPEQNVPERGYGEEVTPTTCIDVLRTSYAGTATSSRFMYRQMWSEFYQVPSLTYEELREKVANSTDQSSLRFVKVGSDVIFDNEVFYKRISVAFDCALIDADARAAKASKNAYLNVVGIGLGVWKLTPHQTDVFVISLLQRVNELLHKRLIDRVCDVNLAYIKPSNSITDSIKNNPVIKSDTHPNGGVRIHVESREPSAKLAGELQGRLLVTTYAWDGNAHPGNEFWEGSLSSSGDPAAACSTQVAELHNAHINRYAVNALQTRVVGRHGILPLPHYCKLLMK